MKKWTLLLLVTTFIFAFTACGDKDETPAETPIETPEDPKIPEKPNYVDPDGPKISQSAYLPAVRIVLDGGASIESINKDAYLTASITIDERNDAGIVTQKVYAGTTEIKGRGNSTWDMPKKPYRLKLTEEADLFKMPANKHWVLLANYSDKTLMRNDLAFEISRRMGFVYTPRMQHVDLYVNGQYQGNYQLGEHLRVAPKRVNIPELKKGDTENISGGYLLEIDERQTDPNMYYRTAKAGMKFCYDTPETPSAIQKTYINTYLQNIENVLYSATAVNDFPKNVDMKTFIDYYLLNELARNVDGNLRLSTYVYKNRDDDKLYFGPVWDYDISFGNVDYGGAQNTAGWHARTAQWYVKFFSHPEFNQMVKNRWNELRASGLKDLQPYIDEMSKQLGQSQEDNFKEWKILDIYVWPNAKVTGSYPGEVAYLKEWLWARVIWMDSQLK